MYCGATGTPESGQSDWNASHLCVWNIGNPNLLTRRLVCFGCRAGPPIVRLNPGPNCQRWQVGRLGAEHEAIPPRPNVQESFKTAFTCSAKRSNANGIHVPSTCGKTANAARESAWTWRLGETGIDRGNRMSVQTVHQPMFFSTKNRVI